MELSKLKYEVRCNLEQLVEDQYFMSKGQRNNDAVDLCIMCHVLHEDPLEYAKLRCNRIKKNPDGATYIDLRNRVKKITPYLEKWGEVGKEYKALDFLTRDYEFPNSSLIEEDK